MSTIERINGYINDAENAEDGGKRNLDFLKSFLTPNRILKIAFLIEKLGKIKGGEYKEYVPNILKKYGDFLENTFGINIAEYLA